MKSLASILLLAASSLHGQEFRRWELGAQLVRLDLDSLGEAPLGGGGRASYFVTRWLAIDAEGNRFFEDPSGNFGHTQFVAGPRAGISFGPVGIFAKARPGFVRLGGGVAERNPGRENNACLDVGGVITVGTGRAGMRLDAGDTIIFWGSQPFNAASPLPISQHNRQLSVGFFVRF